MVAGACTRRTRGTRGLEGCGHERCGKCVYIRPYMQLTGTVEYPTIGWPALFSRAQAHCNGKPDRKWEAERRHRRSQALMGIHEPTGRSAWSAYHNQPNSTTPWRPQPPSTNPNESTTGTGAGERLAAVMDRWGTKPRIRFPPKQPRS